MDTVSKIFDIIPDGETDLKFRMRRNYAFSKSHLTYCIKHFHHAMKLESGITKMHISDDIPFPIKICRILKQFKTSLWTKITSSDHH